MTPEISEAAASDANDAAKPLAAPLLSDVSFWGMTITQFLGAFNDNIYKQTLLLLFVAIPVGLPGETEPDDLQGVGTFLFAAPFILFSGLAGYLSDRYSKRNMIVACKAAEVAIMLGGCLLFLLYRTTGMSSTMTALLLVGLFCMGSQSAFFGPCKYGVLPELFRERDLPQANGIMLMTTFLAIIFGVTMAGGLMTLFSRELWTIGLVCIAVAVLGVATSLMIRPTPAVQPGVKFHWGYIVVPIEMRRFLAQDNQLHAALWVSSVFWMAAQMVLTTVNALGIRQLGVSEALTSMLVGSVSVGIALGSLAAGALSQGRFRPWLVKYSAWGLVVCLVALALPGGAKGQLLGYAGSLVVLVILGGYTGAFAVPLQVLMQMRPPGELKGQTIATMNLMNWTGIVLGSVLYQGLSLLLNRLEIAPSWLFLVSALLLGGVALLYRPQEMRLHA
jgi:MFS family permease